MEQFVGMGGKLFRLSEKSAASVGSPYRLPYGIVKKTEKEAFYIGSRCVTVK